MTAPLPGLGGIKDPNIRQCFEQLAVWADRKIVGSGVTVSSDRYSVLLSAGAGGGTGGATFTFSASNTSYSNSVILTGSNAATIRSTTGNKVVVDVPTQTVQPAQTGISSIAASDATYTSGQVQFTGSNAATIKTSAGQRVVVDVPTQTTQPAQTGISSIAASDATYTSGQVQFTGSNIVTVKSSAGQRVVIDATTAALTVQPVGSLGISSNTTGTTASLPFASNIMLQAGDNITLSQSSGTNSSIIRISGATAAAAADTGSVVPLSNTTGTTASIPLSKPFGLAGGANITLSQSSGTNSTNLTIIGPAAGGGAAFTLSGSNTSYSDSAVLTGSNIVTVKSTTGHQFVFDASTSQSVQPVGSLNIGSNTTGTSASLPFASNIQLQGGPNITLSQSSGTNSSIVAISAAAAAAGAAQTAVSRALPYQNQPFGRTLISGAAGNVVYFQGFSQNENLSVDSAEIVLSAAALTTASTGGIRLDAWLGTRNGSTLSSLTTVSTNFTWTSGSGASTNWQGVSNWRMFGIPLAYSMTPGEYYLGIQVRSNSNWNPALMAETGIFGQIQRVASSATFSGAPFGFGSKATNVAALGSLAANGLSIHSSTANFLPVVLFRNTASIPW